jgi:hypothetical protein
MSDDAALILAQVLGGAVLLGSCGLFLWIFRVSLAARSPDIWVRVVAKEALTLQTFAARVGGTYEAGHGVDAWGRDVPVAGSVTGLDENRWARLGYVSSGLIGEAVSFFPLVSIDLPPGARWAVQPTAGSWVRHPRLIVTVNTPGRIPGSAIRVYADNGRGPQNFRKAFGVPEDATPDRARALLWSVGEGSHLVHFSPQRLEVILRPRDRTSTGSSRLAPQQEEGYDVDELADFVGQVCALASALLVSDAPG